MERISSQARDAAISTIDDEQTPGPSPYVAGASRKARCPGTEIETRVPQNTRRPDLPGVVRGDCWRHGVCCEPHLARNIAVGLPLAGPHAGMNSPRPEQCELVTGVSQTVCWLERPQMRPAIISVACAAGLGLVAPLLGQVPVHLEPRHPAVFENAALRVLNVNIDAGDTTLDHVHANDIAIVCISGCELRTRIGSGSWGDWASRVPGQVMGVAEYAGQPIVNAHQAGHARYHVISVENLRQKDWPRNTPEPNPSGTLTNETRAFRIYDVHLPAGKESRRSTANGSIVVIVIDGQVTVSGKGTEQSKVLTQPGDWAVIPTGATEGIKAGGSAARAIEIDVR